MKEAVLSVSKVNQLLHNKGCVWILSGLMALGVGMGTLQQCGNHGQNQPEASKNASPVIFQAGEFSPRVDELSNTIKSLTQGRPVEPEQALQIVQSSLTQLKSTASLIRLADKRGIKISDDVIRDEAAKAFDLEIARTRAVMINKKLIKANATDAEFKAALMKATNIDLDQKRKEVLENAVTKSDFRTQMLLQALPERLVAQVKETMKPTDEEVKAGFDTIVTKSIYVDPAKFPNPKAKAEEILKEAKAGKSFEALMDRYLQSPDKTKPASSQTISERRMNLSNELEAALKGAKPGAIVGPLSIGGAYEVRKLVEVKPNVPKDFAQRKKTYVDDYVATKAKIVISDEMMAASDSEIVWKQPTLEALDKFTSLTMKGTPKPEELQELLSKVEADQDMVDPLPGVRAMLTVRIIDQLIPSAKGDDVKSMFLRRAEAYERALASYSSSAGYVVLADYFGDAKEGAKAVDALKTAISIMSSEAQTDPSGMAVGRARLTGVKMKLAKSGVLTPEMVKDVDNELAAADKAIAELNKEIKKQQLEQERLEKEAKKRFDEEQKKAGKSPSPAPKPSASPESGAKPAGK